MDLLSDYLALGAALNLPPKPMPPVAVPADLIDRVNEGARELGFGAESTPLATLVWEVSTEYGAVVGTVANDWSSGCPDCLVGKYRAIPHFYPELGGPPLDMMHSATLVLALWVAHNVNIAITDAYAPQNWSVITPAPECSRCGHLARTIDAMPGILRPTGDGVGQSMIDSTMRIGGPTTGGQRALSPSEFVANCRPFVGFASALGNPIPVPSGSPSQHLTNSPILIGGEQLAHEVAGGKGDTFEQSVASCVGEGLERYFLSGVYRNPGTVETYASLVRRGLEAIDPVADIGFPLVKTQAADYTPDLPIEWTVATDLATSAESLIPANLVYCPYVPARGASTIVTGSTNGTAAGATIRDATNQAMLDVIERDAFWYYARTGKSPVAVERDDLPNGIAIEMDESELSFRTMLLLNPFGIPVAQVVTSSSGRPSRTARGTGAGLTAEHAIRRAYAECIQMYASLSTGIDVAANDNDMRYLWHSGLSQDIWPNFFAPSPESESALLSIVPLVEFATIDEARAHILEVSVGHGIRWYVTSIMTTEHFAIAKVLNTRVSVIDASYFTNNARLRDFARSMGHPEGPVVYDGPLFM
jgi:hypothetical protein